MALVALLFAHHTVVGATEPFASIAVAGLSSLERQVRLVRHLGSERVLIVAERMPPLLAGALARLGGDATIVRDPALLAGSLKDDDRILVIEEGLLPDAPAAARFLSSAQPTAIAIAAGEPPYPQAERLDAESFWAGLAVYGAPLVRTVAMDLGEWDLQSTLLRSAVGEGIPRVDIGAPALQSVRDERDAERAATALSVGATRARPTWPARYLYAAVERLSVPALLSTRATGTLLWAAALTGAALAAVAFASGWLWGGLALALSTELAAGLGERIARIRLEPARRALFDKAMTLLLEPGWYLALAFHLDSAGHGGAWALAVMIVGFRWASDRQWYLVNHFAGPASGPTDARDRRLALFAAGPDTLPWLLLPFALFGEWAAGFVALAAYSVVTFFAVQSCLLRRIEPEKSFGGVL